MNFTDRNVVVLGAGLTGLSLARFFVAHGAAVRVADTREAPPRAADLAALRPAVALTTGPFTAATMAGADLIAISPGVAQAQAVIADAVAHGAELVGDIEIFARGLPPGQKVLAITGSNGKSTVTALTGSLCRAAGLTCVVAGNIGDAVLDAVAPFEAGEPWPDVFVLELSSFQLETTTSLRPVAAAVLNVTDNHLDRYPGMDEYAAAKARIFDGGGVQVVNRDDPRSLAMRIQGRTVENFGVTVPAEEGEWGLVDFHGSTWLARGGELLLPADALALVGRHNALNALAALALTSTVARIDRRVLDALRSFRGLPHRMEKVAESRGVLFINDSKATTVVATQAALDGIGRPAVLICGGDGKGQDFRPLKSAVDADCRAALLIGRDAPLIAQALEGSRATVEVVGTLEAAVARALALARPGDAVLLSPACASLDQFGSYVERGERFSALVTAREPAHA
ncbi:MAG TPA: UDP-N-acetylmuramoyl-L-alanine--D-glutamate ligase [Casimicrobiaceae bacterium]|nr:UDP-N-acetylmuramoyl-L-alanine--D-glutamate ligase [Casimicrobiaceae bacterium]